MSAHDSIPARLTLPRRRLALMAGAAGIGVALLFGGDVRSGSSVFSLATPARAQNAQRPVGFADIVEKVKPAVISVRVRMGPQSSSLSGDDNPFGPGSPLEEFFRRFGRPDGGPNSRSPNRRNQVTGQGSGFFISADGFAVTNNHVVDRAANVEVVTDDGRSLEAKVVGTDPRTDLALLKLNGNGPFPYVRLAESSPRVGDWVVAVGNPFGLGGTVTAGIVSARGRDIGNGPYDDFIQIDAPVNRGNSGGPTFNLDGEVIGVNTAIFSPSGGSVGIAFAIPAETVKSVVTSLRDTGTVSRGWIGVQIQPVTQPLADNLGLAKAEGALISEAQSDGPAAKVGLKSGDVITQVNGKPIRDARDLARRIGAEKPGVAIKLTVVTDRKERVVEMTPGEFPNQPQVARLERGPASTNELPRLGLTLAPAQDGQGVAVRDIDPDGPAAEAGLRVGDVILDVNGKAIAKPADVREILQAGRGERNGTILMRVKTGDNSRYVAIRVGRG
jgi:serine protease Do